MIKTGRTTPGATNWQFYLPNAIFVDVDTSTAGFANTPNYVTSLGGNLKHWESVGATSIYDAGLTKFRVYVRFADGALLSPADANSYGWHINWIGMEP